MVAFQAYIDGKPARSINLAGAHLVGSEGLPLRAEITAADGVITCLKRTVGAASLSVLWPVRSAGVLMLETARVPERDRPYVLNVELARARLMRIVQKLEDWGIFDNAALAEVNKRLNRARDLFIASLQADDPVEAARQADESLALAVPASEAMARVHADLFLQRKRNGTAARRGLGVSLPLVRLPADALAGLQARIRELCDVVSLQMPWRLLQPREHESDYSFDVADEHIRWLVASRIPIVAGPLVSFAEEQIPDWLILYENDFDAVRDMAVEHVRRVVQRYGRYVTFWRVVSGLHADNAMSFPFEQVMDLTRVAVTTVKQLAPKAVAIVEVTEPWGEYYALKTRTVPPVMYAEVLLQSGINFDAFGLRLPMGMPARGGFVRDLFQISSMIDRFGTLGRPLHITGFGVPSDPRADARNCLLEGADPMQAGYWRNSWAEPVQGYWAGHFARMALSKPYLETLTWEDLSDGLPHLVPNGGMLRPDGSPKPVYDELLTVRKQLILPRNGAPAKRNRGAR